MNQTVSSGPMAKRRSSVGNQLLHSSGTEGERLLQPASETNGNDAEEIVTGSPSSCPIALRNVIFLSLGFLFVFSAFQTTQGYAVPLLGDFGSISLAVLYSVFSAANFFAPLIVHTVGYRLSLALGGLGYTLYIFSLVYILPYLVLIAAVFVGVGAGVIWTAQGKVLVSNSTSTTIARFSGYFWSIFMFGFAMGNAVGSTILLFENNTGIPVRNASEWPNGWQGSQSVLFVSLGGMSLIGLFFFGLIRRAPTSGSSAADVSIPVKEQIVSIFRLLCDKRTVLLVPFMVYIGWATTFYASQFTRQIPSRTNVGFTMAVFGLAEIVGSNMGGWVSKRYNSTYVVLAGVVCETAALITTYFADATQGNLVNPNFREMYLFVVAAIFLGFADSFFNTQSYILIQGYYRESEVLNMAALQKFLQSIATTIGFFVNPFLVDASIGRSTPSQLRIELITVGIFLALNLIGYITLSLSFKKKNGQDQDEEEAPLIIDK